LTARERLAVEGRWEDCRREIIDLMDHRNECTDGRLLVPAEYLGAVGRTAEA
jgi:hypothetical protein